MTQNFITTNGLTGVDSISYNPQFSDSGFKVMQRTINKINSDFQTTGLKVFLQMREHYDLENCLLNMRAYWSQIKNHDMSQLFHEGGTMGEDSLNLLKQHIDNFNDEMDNYNKLLAQELIFNLLAHHSQQWQVRGKYQSIKFVFDCRGSHENSEESMWDLLSYLAPIQYNPKTVEKLCEVAGFKLNSLFNDSNGLQYIFLEIGFNDQLDRNRISSRIVNSEWWKMREV
jgi:hypothetical protein